MLACLLDLPVELVPNFNTFYWTPEERTNIKKVFDELWSTDEWRDHNYSIAMNMWHNALTYWLASRGYKVTIIPADTIQQWVEENPDKPYMVSGLTKRGLNHITIYQNGKLLHDPHPHNEEIIDDSHRMYEILEKIC